MSGQVLAFRGCFSVSAKKDSLACFLRPFPPFCPVPPFPSFLSFLFFLQQKIKVERVKGLDNSSLPPNEIMDLGDLDAKIIRRNVNGVLYYR